MGVVLEPVGPKAMTPSQLLPKAGQGVQGPVAKAPPEATKPPVNESSAKTASFPANQGFLGDPQPLTLKENQLIDRYGGSDYSRFFSPPGTPEAARALPPGTVDQPLRTFQVLRPFEVQSGTVAPAYGQAGLGTQYRSPMQLGDLLQQGFLKEVTP
jgi:Tuberculosis necrotizing toxin